MGAKQAQGCARSSKTAIENLGKSQHESRHMIILTLDRSYEATQQYFKLIFSTKRCVLMYATCEILNIQDAIARAP